MPKPYHVKDKYFLKAKEEGFRARSAYKLQEIQEKFRVLHPNDHILDLGCAPGSWLQYASGIVTELGCVMGVDLEPVELIEGVQTIQGDVFADEVIDAIHDRHLQQFTVVMSDMAPKTTGIKDTDQYHSVELNEQVLHICSRILKYGGSVILKIFVGADFQRFYKVMREQFETVKQLKPEATRDRSFEVYLIGKGYRGSRR